MKNCLCICHEHIGNGVLGFGAHDNQKCVCNGGEGFNNLSGQELVLLPGKN
jgi:hypothetical protein